MIYLAADNNLCEHGFADLTAIKSVGSTRRVTLIAQMDPSGRHRTRRFVFRNRRTTLDEDEVYSARESNTGDPGEMEDFVLWSIANYPAKLYALIIWGHGTGWDDGDACLQSDVAKRDESRNRRAGGVASDWKIPDESKSSDALTCDELACVLRRITSRLGRKNDLLGMDACLMAMAEVAYQIAPYADVYVASQETEPNEGWPYAPILRQLVSRPRTKARGLAKLIVEKYVARYRSSEKNAGLSACDLSKAEKLACAVKQLGSTLDREKCDVPVLAAISASRRDNRSPFAGGTHRALSFHVNDYIDLFDFCELLRDETENRHVRRACLSVMKVIEPKGFVIKSSHNKFLLARSHGVSVYFPSIAHCYGELEFSKRTGWDRFLYNYLGVALAPAKHKRWARDDSGNINTSNTKRTTAMATKQGARKTSKKTIKAAKKPEGKTTGVKTTVDNQRAGGSPATKTGRRRSKQ